MSKGPKYREAQPFTWKQNFKLVMDAVEVYAKDWAKHEGESVDVLSEWLKAVRRLIKRRLYIISNSINLHLFSVILMFLKTLKYSTTNMLLSQQIKPLTTLYLYVKLTITAALFQNSVLKRLVVIPLTNIQHLVRMKSSPTTGQSYHHSEFLLKKRILNCLYYTGFPSYTKTLTNNVS